MMTSWLQSMTSGSASAVEPRFCVGDVVDVLNACRLPQAEQAIHTGTVERITESSSGEALYWVSGRAAAVTARVLRLVQRAHPKPADPTIRIASVPCGASDAFLHPACCGSDLAGVEYHDLTLAELVAQDIVYCDGCGERIVPAGVSRMPQVGDAVAFMDKPRNRPEQPRTGVISKIVPVMADYPAMARIDVDGLRVRRWKRLADVRVRNARPHVCGLSGDAFNCPACDVIRDQRDR